MIAHLAAQVVLMLRERPATVRAEGQGGGGVAFLERNLVTRPQKVFVYRRRR